MSDAVLAVLAAAIVIVVWYGKYLAVVDGLATWVDTRPVSVLVVLLVAAGLILVLALGPVGFFLLAILAVLAVVLLAVLVPRLTTVSDQTTAELVDALLTQDMANPPPERDRERHQRHHEREDQRNDRRHP